MRHLATIQRISKIEPIEGADNIELVHVLGWQCVAKKGEFKEGDLCIYYEIDSFLPIKPIYAFLRMSSYKHTEFMGDGYRLRTQKFRGALSQGLVLPLETVFSDYSSMVLKIALSEAEMDPESLIGKDVTEMLGVKLYEIPEMATSGGTTIGQISSIGVPHTDETRIQAEPDLLEEFRGIPYYITTKMDGSSHSCAITEDGVFHVTGHNYEYRDDGMSGMYELAKRIGVEDHMRQYMADHNIRSMILQGELCAPGIQKNKLQLKEPHWYVFTVIEDGKRVGYYETVKACDEMYLEMVPVEEKGDDLLSAYADADELLKRAGENRCHAYPGIPEGIVVRPIEPIYSTTIKSPLSMKVINNKYLLRSKD